MKKKQAAHSRGKVRRARQVTLSGRRSRQLWLEEQTATRYAFALEKQGGTAPQDKETS